jgi:2-polyprenyl-6-methoxyphenol hydroxylase-like FAD-dependent oxidoreductase
MERILIVGGGLVGSVLGMHLARRGDQVEIYELRPDPRKASPNAGRSINLTLCERGLQALAGIGITEEIRALSIPVFGRIIHELEGSVAYQTYGNRGEALYSISRNVLNCAVLTFAEERFGIKIHFGQKCVEVDLARPAASFRDAETGQIVTREAERIFGADGAYSAVRLQMQKLIRFDYSQHYLEQEYKELTVPPARDGGWPFDENALHLWPRGHYMLIGFPNLDRSFTLSLHLPVDREPSFATIATADELCGLFRASFPDVLPLLETLMEEYFNRPAATMVTTRCFPWTHADRVALIGDAAHSIVPSYGQGANAGFEDCAVLLRCLEAEGGCWTAAFREYERQRKPDAEAVANLALEHFHELRDLVGDSRFRLRKALELRIAERHPDRYTPLYNLISFTSVPYAEACRIEARQRYVVDRLLDLEGSDRMLETGEIDRHIDAIFGAPGTGRGGGETPREHAATEAATEKELNVATKVVIVGGGTAGWMTASHLKKALPGLDITLIESSKIKTIGVGEATFSTIKLFFDFLGLDESEWMPSCNASYKLAIKFVDWMAGGGHFFHPFQRHEVVDGFNLGEWWLKLKRHEEPFDYACFVVPALCDAQRSPRFLDGRVFDDKVQDYFRVDLQGKRNILAEHKVQYPYAYHFDASLLAEFLKGYATRRGVRQVIDDVGEVKLRDDGSIDHLVTLEHGVIRGDLYVDCTGFSGLLINQALREPFHSFSESLLCDRAVAMQVPRDIEVHGINPYTTATALTAGWVWNIPLYGRIGTGYVYSSAFLSKEAAETEFRRHLGPAADGLKAAHIGMRIGRCRNSWVKNCVAIGLASGFVEPLESTGIFFIQHGIEELVNHFPGAAFDDSTARSYNRVVGDCIDGVRDFLILHYYSTDRADTEFWRATKSIKVPEELAERFELWKQRLPNARSINPRFHGFEAYSYSVMLLGLNYRPASSLPALDHIEQEKARLAFRLLRERTDRLVSTLPSQLEYLTHVRSTTGVSARLQQL